MTTQEENWEMMTLLGLRWDEAAKIEGDDRLFLLTRANEIKVDLMNRREQQVQIQNQERQQMMAGANQQPPQDGQ